MPLLPTELLKKLGSGVRPDGVQTRRNSQRVGVDFSALIASARAGRIRSDRPARNEHDGLDGSWDRIRSLVEEAMDRAEAAGVSRLLIAHGSTLMTADIAQRTVRTVDCDGSSALDLSPEAVLFITEHEDCCGELEELDSIESGTRSANGKIAPSIGWITNRAIGDVVASMDRGGRQE